MPDEPALTPERLTLTPQEATAKLAELQNTLHPPPPIQPTTAEDARARLVALTGDPRWDRAVLGGDVVATKEFHDLTAASAANDDVAAALAGVEPTQPTFETTYDGGLPRRDIARAVADFRADGLNDAAIEQAMKGGSVSV